jgi:hypothetical protein
MTWLDYCRETGNEPVEQPITREELVSLLLRGIPGQGR